MHLGMHENHENHWNASPTKPATRLSQLPSAVWRWSGPGRRTRPTNDASSISRPHVESKVLALSIDSRLCSLKRFTLLMIACNSGPRKNGPLLVRYHHSGSEHPHVERALFRWEMLVLVLNAYMQSSSLDPRQPTRHSLRLILLLSALQ